MPTPFYSTGVSVIVRRIDDASDTNGTSTTCPHVLSLLQTCFSTLNLTMIGPNTFAVQPVSKYVVGKLAGDDTCIEAACPLGWGLLRLTRVMEAAGEFVPDLVGSAFHVADGSLAASLVASAIGDEINPFAALRMRIMGEGDGAEECTVRCCCCKGRAHLHATRHAFLFTQTVYRAPNGDLGDIFDVATPDVVIDADALVKAYGK